MRTELRLRWAPRRHFSLRFYPPGYFRIEPSRWTLLVVVFGAALALSNALTPPTGKGAGDG